MTDINTRRQMSWAEECAMYEAITEDEGGDTWLVPKL